MSNQNENLEPKQNSEQIGINENGELVVNDLQLAEALQELSPEELEAIFGGDLNGYCPTTNTSCSPTKSLSLDAIPDAGTELLPLNPRLDATIDPVSPSKLLLTDTLVNVPSEKSDLSLDLFSTRQSDRLKYYE